MKHCHIIEINVISEISINMDICDLRKIITFLLLKLNLKNVENESEFRNIYIMTDKLSTVTMVTREEECYHEYYSVLLF